MVKHFTLIAIIASLVLFTIAASRYPGGSQADINSVGFDLKNNYLCNLFTPKAVNGANNGATPWAIAGMLILCSGLACFFIRFSERIPSKSSANIIKYCGAGAMLVLFFVVTPLHDLMTKIACTLELLALFYITVFLFKTKFTLFKILSVVCLAVLYFTMYVYFSSTMLSILPTLQKLIFLVVVSLMLGLTYFTSKEDFAHIKLGKKGRG